MAELINDRLYRGERTKEYTQVTVHDSPGEFGTLAAPPAGFDWGRPNDRSLALAAALLADAVVNADGALQERFFHEVVLQLPFLGPWVLWRSELQAWALGEKVPVIAS